MIPSSVTNKKNTEKKEICKLNKDILVRRTTTNKQKKSTGIYCDFLSSRNSSRGKKDDHLLYTKK